MFGAVYNIKQLSGAKIVFARQVRHRSEDPLAASEACHAPETHS